MQKVCMISDDIVSNTNYRVIENVMNAKITTAKAYSSVYDDDENEAKQKTRFPTNNFVDIIDQKVCNDKPDILIVQAGSLDVTNLKTGGNNPEKYGEYFKQEAVMSATNLFTGVTNALEKDPNLKKVILMKQIPRYDRTSDDPRAVKSALSQLYNDTLVQLWLQSKHKDRLTIGTHSLECAGAIRESRYRFKNRFDGIHLYGPSGGKAYTESVLGILKSSGLVKNSPPKYFRRFHMTIETEDNVRDKYYCPTQDTDWKNDKDIRPYKQRYQSNHYYKYEVPTSNRFACLNQGNY